MTKNKKSKTKGRTLSGKQLRSEILKMFKRFPKKRFHAKQIIKKLKINNSKASVTFALNKLTENEQLFEKEGKFRLNKKAMNQAELGRTRNKGRNRKRYVGKVDMTRLGTAYIECDDLEEDVHISSKYINGAMNGDKVEIVAWRPRGRKKMEGEIVKVLERSTTTFLGTLKVSKNYGFVVPDGNNYPTTDIYVKAKDFNGAKDQDKVVVKVVEWPTREGNSPRGQVTLVLGEKEGNDFAMKSILINNGFELTFPEAVLEQAEKISENITDKDIASRRDMREVTTFTIDPSDAKDFDDAISIKYLENGHCEVGVHIADVTHYVKTNTKLDKEAYKRSTSVYLVDRVLPMLPEKLSTRLCSLRPNEDKLTFSVVFTFDKDDKVIDSWIGKTITHSDRRFDYEEVQEILDSGEGDLAAELKKVNQLARVLRKKRFKEGSINFETDEVKFRLDENAVPIEAYIKERKESNLLIEDFMLLANQTVARYMSKKGERLKREIPFVYRVHDTPDPEKVANFAQYARELGVELKVDTPAAITKAYNKLSKLIEQNQNLKILEPLAIRTMAKAEYTTDNIGHYGLSFEYYSHFTSPIRRYSDVLAHRLLYSNLKRTYRVDKEKLQEKCRHISSQERKAMDAERASTKYKQVEYIQKHIGETFTGIITGMIEKGIFVELKANKCEGMVEFANLPEPYRVGEARLKAKSIISGKEYKVGQEVQVQIAGADLAKREIDMVFVEGEGERR